MLKSNALYQEEVIYGWAYLPQQQQSSFWFAKAALVWSMERARNEAVTRHCNRGPWTIQLSQAFSAALQKSTCRLTSPSVSQRALIRAR